MNPKILQFLFQRLGTSFLVVFGLLWDKGRLIGWFFIEILEILWLLVTEWLYLNFIDIKVGGFVLIMKLFSIFSSFHWSIWLKAKNKKMFKIDECNNYFLLIKYQEVKIYPMILILLIFGRGFNYTLYFTLFDLLYDIIS